MQIINTTAPGDSAKIGGDKINANFRETLRREANQVVTPLFDGDSKGSEPKAALAWIAAQDGLEINFRGQNDEINIGGSNSGSGSNGLTSSARMANIASTLAASTAAGQIVDYFLTIGTNDTSAQMSPLATMANVRKLHEQVLRTAPCFRYLMLMSVDPREGGASYIRTINRMYEEYARANPHDVIFLDTTNALIDPSAANTTGRMVPYTTSSAPYPAGSYSDGLHLTQLGIYAKRLAMAPIKHLYRKRPQRPMVLGMDGTGTNGFGSSFITPTRWVSMGGTSSATGGTVTGTPAPEWDFYAALTGSLAVTFSTQTVTSTGTGPIPVGTWPCVRMTFSGTTGAAVTTSIKKAVYPPNGIQVGDVAVMGALLNLNNLTNILGFGLGTNASSALSIKNASYGGNAQYGASPEADILTQPLSGSHLLEGNRIISDYGTGGLFCEFDVFLPANKTITGSIDILSIYGEIIPAIPAAAS